MPYPLTDGGAIGIYNITKYLAARGHQVTLVTYPLERQFDTMEAVSAISSFAKVELASKPLPPRWRVLARTVFQGAYPIQRRMMPEMFELIERIVRAEKFDVVHLDHSHMGRYGMWLKEKFGLPVILRQHNFESQIYERFASTERNLLKRSIATVHGRRLRREEVGFLLEFDAIAAISAEDVNVMKIAAPTGRYTIIPAGVDTGFFSPDALKARSSSESSSLSNSILFVGTLDWDPNYDALRYFLHSIFPGILKKRPNTVLHVVGGGERRIIPFAKQFGNLVKVHGRVPDIRDFLAQSAVLVVPLRIGGGMRVKILEFFAAGKAIVSTSMGAEGNIGRDGEHLLLRDSDESFAEGVTTLLSNPTLRNQLGVAARELAISSYSWTRVAGDLTDLYVEVLTRRGQKLSS